MVKSKILIDVFNFLLDTIMEGTIKVLKAGFGFITAEGQSGDMFFHAKNLVGMEFDSLEEWMNVRYEVGEGNNGKEQALNVEVIQD